MGNSPDGIILIDKNEGETSFAVARKVGRILKVKKAGHAGTLDPFATGLLIVLLGQGTKLSPYLMSGEKKYLATLRLGVETDTQDLKGHMIHARPVAKLSPETIREKARDFIGEVEQIPPIFSAVRYRGKRAYQFARQGIKIDLEKKRVRIYALHIISIDLPDVTMEVVCSSGTYIRTLASDFGKALGPGAHLITLRRFASGPFKVRDAVDLRGTGAVSPEKMLKDKVIPLRKALPHLEEIQIDDQMARKIRNGHQPAWESLISGSDFMHLNKDQMKLVTNGALVAIAQVHYKVENNGGSLKILRVFR
jgi:tRNA pseudouridine55 synthase